MIGAAWYLTRRTFANGMRRRLKRLREPRYLLAFAVGLLYFYFVFGRPGSARFGRPSVGGGDAENVELLLTWALLVFVGLNWVFGESQTPLPFTQAETQFLFTAPLTRRQVIAFKLLRLQLPLLTSATISVLLFSRGHLTPMRIVQAGGAWILFTTMSLHFAAASFVRANLAEHGVTGLRRQVVVLAVFGTAAAIALWTIRAALPGLSEAISSGGIVFFAELGRVSAQGALAVLLLPFRLAVGPAAARTPADFIAALPAALALLTLHYVWVIRSAIHFEEVAVEDAQRRARRVAAARRGRAELRSSKGKLRRPWYRLRPVGHPAEAFLWKSLLAVTRHVGRRLFIIVGFGVAAVAFVAAQGKSGATGRSVAGAMLVASGALTVLFGPRVLRQDLREDLLLLDVLKAYPVAGRDIVLGEALGVTIALTAFAWLATGAGVALLASMPSTDVPLGGWAFVAAAGFVAVPGLLFIQVTAQNGFAVLFPAWSALGTNVSAGLERLGQQILVMIGSLLLLLLVLIPAGIVGGLTALVLQGVSAAIGTLAGTVTGAAVLVFEAYLATYFIGARLDKTDPADLPGSE